MTISILSDTTTELLKPEVYYQQRCALIRFFEWNGARDSADLADEVFCRLLKAQVKIESLPAFVHGIAQNVLLEHWREREREQSLVDEIARHPTGSFMTEAEAQNLEECFKCLSRKEGSLLRAFYAYEDGHKADHRLRLAKRYGLSINALRIRAARARKKVVTYLEQSQGWDEADEMNSPNSSHKD